MINRRGFLGLFAGISAIPEVKSVERLVIRPEDILVVKLDRRASEHNIQRVKELIESKLPKGVKVLVHDSSVELSVLRKE